MLAGKLKLKKNGQDRIPGKSEAFVRRLARLKPIHPGTTCVVVTLFQPPPDQKLSKREMFIEIMSVPVVKGIPPGISPVKS
jgi:hypothetical protein